MSSKSREWLLYNAVLSWLSHYGGMGSDLTPQYQQLQRELQFEYEDVDEQPTPTKTQRRGRPAKRQRTKKAASNPASTKENQTVNQEA